MRMSPIDNLLFTTSKSFREWLRGRFTPISKTWNKLEQQGIYNITDYYSSFQNYELTKSLGSIFGRTYLKLDNWNLKVYSRENGRVFINQNDASNCEREFILCTRRYDPLSMEPGFQNSGKLFGPKTLRIFEKIGYATINNPKMAEFAPEL